MRYSDIYKKMIQGDDCCPFWWPEDSGICVGWPGEEKHPCPANEDGSGCPIFPNNKRK